jgi:hypothetical protein
MTVQNSCVVEKFVVAHGDGRLHELATHPTLAISRISHTLPSSSPAGRLAATLSPPKNRKFDDARFSPVDLRQRVQVD